MDEVLPSDLWRGKKPGPDHDDHSQQGCQEECQYPVLSSITPARVTS